jgi:tRNA nucleotidyltransferase/poly(A) polymerase
MSIIDYVGGLKTPNRVLRVIEIHMSFSEDPVRMPRSQIRCNARSRLKRVQSNPPQTRQFRRSPARMLEEYYKYSTQERH